MSRLSERIAIAAIAAVTLGGSAWAWTQVRADAELAMRPEFTDAFNFPGDPTQSVLLPFFCHW